MATPATWNFLLGTPTYSDVTLGQTPTLSGGSWVAGLPLTNLQSRQLSKVARSTGVTLANTQFEIDLKIPRPIRVFSIPKHTLSLAGYVRIRGWTGAGGTGTNAYDTGWLPGNTKPINLAVQSERITAANGWTVGAGVTATAEYAASGDVSLTRFTGADTNNVLRVVTYKRDGAKGFSVVVQWDGVAGTTEHGLYDNTASAWRCRIRVTWAADGTATAVAVNGVLSQFERRDNSDLAVAGDGLAPTYRIHARSSAVTAANVHHAFPHYPGTATSVRVGGVQADPESYPLEYVRTDAVAAMADTTGMNAGFLHVAPSSQIARYWLTEIDDTTNAAGYVDLARLILAGGIQPTINLSYGLKFGVEDATESEDSDGGATLYNPRPKRRIVTASLVDLPEDESLRQIYEMQRREGKSGQIVFVYDPSDVYHVHRRSFLCVNRELSPLERAQYGRDTIPLSFREEL